MKTVIASHKNHAIFRPTKMSVIAVLTSGGDAPGMNAAIQAVVKIGAARGYDILGIERGFGGLIKGQVRELTHRTVGGEVVPFPGLDSLGSIGGTILGSSRCPEFKDPKVREKGIEFLNTWGAGGLIVIGGNGSMAGAHDLAAQWDHPVVGIPASIDNDIGRTREAIGVDTALNTIVEACDRISDTAQSHHRAFVVEVMGRDSGYLAMSAAMATAADAVLLPEHGRTIDEVIVAVEQAIRKAFSVERSKRRVLIIKAEGVGVWTHLLVEEVAARMADTDVEIRGAVLGHLVRGGNPSYRDRMLAGRFGLTAVDILLSGVTDVMVGWNLTDLGAPTSDPWIRTFSIDDVLTETRALLDGSSDVTIDRLRRIENIQGVLSI